MSRKIRALLAVFSVMTMASSVALACDDADCCKGKKNCAHAKGGKKKCPEKNCKGGKCNKDCPHHKGEHKDDGAHKEGSAADHEGH